MAKTAAHDLLMIQCEKIVNETWSKAAIHYDALQQIIENGGARTGDEEAIVLIAANAALQKMTLDRSLDAGYGLEEEMSPCGQNPSTQCPCRRDTCLLNI